MNNQEKIWDVIVIGGGPAGMMSAIQASERGLEVLLIEKNDTLGKKLLITGGGRCNVTNSQFDIRKFLEKFKSDGKFLFSTFSQFGVKEALDFFHVNQMPTKVENELRTFPVSNSAQSVWDVLVDNLQKNKVTIFSNSPVVEIIKKEEKIVGVKLKNKKETKEIWGKNIVLATGGTSRPETGSTGDGYKWLENIGHTIVVPKPSLVPIKLKNKWISKLAGLTLTDVKITILQNNTKQDVVKKAKILFTHVGVSGPYILNMSKDIGELLKYGEVIISLDLLPSFDHGQLNTKLQELFKIHDKKKCRNVISSLVPPNLASIIIEFLKINLEKTCNSITREERMSIITLLKNFPLEVDSLLGTDKAIITSGGVVLDEVDFKTMQSRLYPNLYLVGDILNIDRPSGGYSLQLCWSTGFVAGNSIDKN